MGAYRICTIWFIAITIVSGPANGQFNPYAESKKQRVAPGRDAPVAKKKKADASVVAEKERPKAQKKTRKKTGSEAPDEVQAGVASEDAGDSLVQRVAELEKQLAQQRLMLARAGVTEDAASLSAEQRAELGRLETELQRLRADHGALSAAVDNGLDMALVRENFRKIEAEIDAVQQQMQNIREQGSANDTDLAVANHDARIAELERELAMLRKKATASLDDTDSVSVDNPKGRTFRDRINDLLPVEIFAFGDFMYRVEEDAADNFAIGQLELDITQDLIDQLTITAAIAYDGESESIGIGAFTIDGRILGEDETYLRKSSSVHSFGVILGQFDVPFGIDYLEYASIDRRLVTGPVAVDGTHGGWNDLGGQLYLIMPRLNAVLYGVNGYGYETVETDIAGNELVLEYPTAMALGGRVGVLPISQIELGSSLAMFVNSDISLTQLLAGGDLSVQVAGLSLKSEYIYMAQGLESDSRTSTHGMYGGATYDFSPVFVTGRYAMLWPDGGSTERQLSVGGGIQVFENAEIRIEYTTNLESGGSMAFVQLAGGSAWQPSGMRR